MIVYIKFNKGLLCLICNEMFTCGNHFLFLFFQPKADPKEVIRMDDISVTLVAEKVGNPNAMQISFTQNNQFRSIYVFAEDSQVRSIYGT